MLLLTCLLPALASTPVEERLAAHSNGELASPVLGVVTGFGLAATTVGLATQSFALAVGTGSPEPYAIVFFLPGVVVGMAGAGLAAGSTLAQASRVGAPRVAGAIGLGLTAGHVTVFALSLAFFEETNGLGLLASPAFAVAELVSLGSQGMINLSVSGGFASFTVRPTFGRDEAGLAVVARW